MKLTQAAPNHYWKTDDVGAFVLREHGPEAPTHVSAYVIGHRMLVCGDTRPIPIAALTLIAVAEFGPARTRPGDRGAGYTAASYRYGVYAQCNEFGRAGIVILRTDGGGSYWYVLEGNDQDIRWASFCCLLESARLWDLLDVVVHTYHSGVNAGTTARDQLFLNDRLKKRRKGGRVTVEVKPEVTP